MVNMHLNLVVHTIIYILEYTLNVKINDNKYMFEPSVDSGVWLVYLNILVCCIL